MRWTWAAFVLSSVAVDACQLDSRDLKVLESGLLPGDDGSEGGLLVQHSSAAYGPITLAFAASARFLVENTGASTLDAPVVSLEGDGTSAFILTQNECTAALPSGAYCSVAVAFRPLDFNVRNATLTIIGSGRRFDVPLSGSGLEPGGLRLQAAPGSEALFGDVSLQGEQEAMLQLSNPTNASSGPVELISNNAAFRLVPAQGSECASSGFQLASGQACNFRVRFAPTLRGVTDATITARSPDAGSVSQGVSGRALAPARLLVEPARLAFGDVVVAGAAVLDLAISNVGDELLPPITSSVGGEAASDFAVTESSCSEPLPARETCSLSLAFSPRTTGPHAAVLSLEAGRVGSLGVDLSGAGVPAGNLLVSAAENGDFGSVALGSESQRELRISNTSNEPSGPIMLAVNSGDFSIEPSRGSDCVSGVTNLAGGASCDVRARFAPSQRGQRNATLVVSASVGGAALNLSGVGLSLLDIRSDVALDFGSVPQGSTSMRSLTVTNAGDAPAAALSTRVSGLHATNFSVQSNGCLSGLDAQGSCTLDISFAPTTTGSHLAALTLEDESGDVRSVALSGAGLAIGLLGVQPSALAFDPPVIVGQARRGALTVTNRGDTDTGRVDGSVATGTPDFSVTAGTCTAGLAAGQSCDLEVVFTPSAIGPRSGSVNIVSMPAGRLEVPVSGTGSASSGNLASNLVIEPSMGTDFGSTEVGTTVIRRFTLRNTGDFSAGTLVSFGTTAGFSVAVPIGLECQPGVTLLDGGVSCVFSVVFAPTVSGVARATLTVNSALGGSVSANLTGNASGG